MYWIYGEDASGSITEHWVVANYYINAWNPDHKYGDAAFQDIVVYHMIYRIRLYREIRLAEARSTTTGSARGSAMRLLITERLAWLVREQYYRLGHLV